jgi:aryl-alcohol dehydrogenase-like predicted oxidoreductase
MLLGLMAGLPLSVLAPDAATATTPDQPRRPIPKSGETVAAIGLGTWQTLDVAGNAAETAAARETLRRFLELGGQVIDSSPMYGSSEAVAGELAVELGVRDRLFIATKVWTTGREAGIRQMEESMRRLRAPVIDLMQVHNLVDADTHLATLREWKKAGRIRYLGVTHYHEGAYAELERWLRTGALDFVQLNYSLAEAEAQQRMLPLAAETGTAVLVNRPFSKGALFPRVAGKPLPDWAKEIDCASWAQFFLKWILGHPAVTCVIPATRNPKHLADNMAAGLGRLPDEALRRRMAEHFGRI